MGKHKKFIRSEKAKVKLKGAKLPKGLNITKTEFKVKKIVLKEQLQEIRFETGKKKHNIKEVISRLKHHNVSFRTEALKNLKECISYDSNEIFRHIGPIVQGIAMLSLDIEKDVRRQSFKILTDFIITFNATALEPFFNIVSSYLKCAMSHINQSIQEDSLLFLDVLLIYLPKLIMQNHSQIFSNFLDMISKLRADSKPGRTLTMNLGKKTTIIKWRSKILDRLQRMLQILVKDWKSKSNIVSEKESTSKEVFAKNHSPYLSLYNKTSYIENVNLSSIFNKSIGQSDVESLDNGEKTKKYISCLFPLLLESWMEVRPNFSEKESTKSHLVLSNEAAITLKIVLEILECLWEMAEICESELNVDLNLSSWIRKKYSLEFLTQIFCKFPYQQTQESTKNNEKKTKKEILKNFQIGGGFFCLKQNLTLVYLYNMFLSSNIVKNQQFSKNILQYLQSLIENLQITNENLQVLEKSLRSTLIINGKFFVKTDETNFKCLLKTIIEKYRNEHFPKSFAPNIVALLCDIVLSSDNLLSIYGQNEISSWLPILPMMLSKEFVSGRVLKTLTNLGKQKNAVFLNSLAEHAENVIDNIEIIQVTECSNIFEGKKLIMNLFYWIDFWNQDIRNNLVEKIDKNVINKEISNYFKFIILKTHK